MSNNAITSMTSDRVHERVRSYEDHMGDLIRPAQLEVTRGVQPRVRSCVGDLIRPRQLEVTRGVQPRVLSHARRTERILAAIQAEIDLPEPDLFWIPPLEVQGERVRQRSCPVRFADNAMGFIHETQS